MAFLDSFRSMIPQAMVDSKARAIQQKTDLQLLIQSQKELLSILDSTKASRSGPYGSYVADQATADTLNAKTAAMKSYHDKYGGFMSNVNYTVKPDQNQATPPVVPAADSISQSEIVAQAATRRTISQTRRRTHPENYLNTDSIEGQLLTGTVKYRNLLGI